MVDFHTFVAEVKGKKTPLRSVYILEGKNEYLKDAAMKALADADVNFRSNCVRLASNEVDPKRLSEELYAIPLFADKKLVLFTLRRESGKAGIDPEIVEWVNGYLASPSPASVFVLVADSLKGSGIKGIDDSVRVSCGEVSPEFLRKWIVDQAAEGGKKIAGDAVNRLLFLDNSGDLFVFHNHIVKLCAYAGNNGSITSADVDKLVKPSVQYETFDIVKALSGGNAVAAIAVLHGLFDNGMEPQPILGAIAWHFRRLLEAKLLFKKEKEKRRVAERLKMAPDKFGWFASMVEGYSERALKDCHQAILSADLDMKGAKVNVTIVMENLLLKLCRPRNPMGRNS